MNKFKRDIEKAEYVMAIILAIVSFSAIAYAASEVFI